jgi:hypothetical protein
LARAPVFFRPSGFGLRISDFNRKEGEAMLLGSRLLAGQSLTTGVTGIQAMPKLDIVFFLFPTQENLFLINDGREIQQASVKVFDLYVAPVKFH